MIYNGQPWSYRLFAQSIALARGYFVRRGFVGPGYALLAVRHLLDFWIISLALRSVGLTTAAMPSAVALRNWRDLPNVRAVITSPGETWTDLASICSEQGLRLLPVLLAGETALGLEAFEAPCPPGGHILATSGTTGSHKKVLISPAIDADCMRRDAELLGLTQDTVYCLFSFAAWTGPGYKLAVSPWSVGGAVVIEQDRETFRALSRPGITHAVLVPSMLADILAAPVGAFPRNDTMQLAVGGAVMTQTQIDQVKSRITPRLFNWFGSTEVGAIAFTPLATPDDYKWHRLVPDRVVEIVDEADRPLPTGKIGRLRVDAAGGPTGYLHNEAATRAFFRDDFFYTGDLAVVRSDGRMALQGRVTDVINMQGQKISPAPVEEWLADLFGVSGVCLFAMPNDSGEEDICVVIETSTQIDSERLIAAINQKFPGDHRVRVSYVANLPRNEMGKVSRQEVRTKAIDSAGLP